MLTVDTNKEYTMTFTTTNDSLDNPSFKRFFLGEWNPKLSNQEKLNPKNIKKVIFNPPATIVYFTDDTKIVAKAHNEEFDPEKGLMACMMQLMFPTRAEFNRLIDKSVEDSKLNK